MATLIETNQIDGFNVYGVQMVDYTADGVSGRDFGTAVALACFASSIAIETETSAYADVLRARQRKLNDLGECLATIAKDIANLSTDSPESDDRVSDDAFPAIASKMALYGLTFNYRTVEIPIFRPPLTYYDATRKELENTRANLEYAIDMEDNDMQQDMVEVQGLVGKRDNAFNTASKVIKKVSGTADSILRSVGQ